MDDHKRGGLWVCSGCGGEFKWNGESYYFGNMECLKCGRADIWKVFCGVDCRAKAGEPKSWRADEERPRVGPVPAGEGAAHLAPVQEDQGVAPEAPHPIRAPRASVLVLTEQELIEVMVCLVEAAKSKLCPADRVARIYALLDGKLDRAIREARDLK
jgi:hypothetical protein